MQAPSSDFLVDQTNLRNTKVVAGASPEDLKPGEVALWIDRFAFTSNNVTYAAFGEAMQYWKFFPAQEPGWGRIPVWGFGDVTASKAAGVEIGERFYGYFPMSTHLILQPHKVSEAGFFDGAPHRAGLHVLYNQYLRCATDPAYRLEAEAVQMLLRPLFVTSFLIDDFFADNDFFAARRVILSSASSKTAYGTAFCLAQREGIEVVGLTSAANVPFVQSLGCYHQTLTYEQIGQLQADVPSVYIDFSGSGTVRGAVHNHLRDSLAYSCAVGGTHWQDLSGSGGVPGPKPTLFFAPAQIKKRNADWGTAVLQKKIAQSWAGFIAAVGNPQYPWMNVIESHGPDAVRSVLLQMLDGTAAARDGYVLSMHGS